MKKVYSIVIIVLGILELFLLKNQEWIGSGICSLTLIMTAFLSLLDGRKDKSIQDESKDNRYEMALNSLNVAVWQWNDIDNKFSASDNFNLILKYDGDINSLEDLYSIICKEDKEYIQNFFIEMINEKVQESFSLQFVVEGCRGKLITMECSGTGEIKDKTYIMSGLIIDITEKTKQDELLRISEKKYRRALDGSQDIMFIINIENNILTVNGKIAYLLELEQKNEYAFTMEEWLKHVFTQDREKYIQEYSEFLNNDTPYFRCEYRVLTKSGKVVWFKVRGKCIVEEDGKYIYGSINNDTDRKEKELRIDYMSNYDDVTGIPNRRYFTGRAYDMLKESKKSNKKFALVFIDLDNFKYVNDTYGHTAGDNLLVELCKKIMVFLEENWLLARFGGDEFVTAIENIDEIDSVTNIIERIVEAFNEPFLINGKEIYNTVSIGISISENDDDNVQSLLKKADIAMYNAKNHGKNQYFIFNDELAEKLDRELSLSLGLRKAVENKEIYFALQPKYWSKTHKIQGFECLARWTSSELGNVSPIEFIPIAESTGLIIPIGQYLMEEAFTMCNELTNRLDSDFKIAINLSQVQLRDENLFEYIKNKMVEYNISPKNIEFEVTESLIMKSVDKNIEVLSRLKSLGVSIALDDFGTGYSSLNYLKILPIDTVKVDKSFVKDIGKDYKDECIIEKIIELSHLLGLEVVAEGVEYEEQLRYLNEVNCDIIQGYYFSKPKEFSRILQSI
ncbi:sensor domain-containing protein [Clostridium vincentii]|uniref:Phytochrome-like protein cph2 n=1 Tax=Clostridium vincentii TaxID=52704 RepID=A0A2T0BFV2_9CLOT|nr:bifunctional diguanylate cyclase/phosphodiesterase [Clostridium vincentii]PRR82786.1 Phytochrome-like protein cph2 [Clostridium vincentii]